MAPDHEPRVFALHLVETAELEDTKALIPKNYSVDAYIENEAMQFGSGKLILLKAKLSQELATYLAETAIREGQKKSIAIMLGNS